LLSCRLREGFAESGFAMSINGADAKAILLFWGKLGLIAKLWRRIEKRFLHAPDTAIGIRRLHLPIDKFSHAEFNSAWSVRVM
jgi:hypothetical protein